MKKLLMLLALALMATGCARLNPQEYAIKYSTYGETRPLQDLPIVDGGVVHYNIFTESVAVFPGSDYRHKYITEDPNHGTFSFNDKFGNVYEAEAAITISLGNALLSKYVKTYGLKLPLENAVTTVVQDEVRSAITSVGSKFEGRRVMSEERNAFTKEVKDLLASQLLEKGIYLKEFTFLGTFNPPPAIAQAIINSQLANEKAKQAENEKAEAIAQGEKAKAKAKAEAEIIVTKAESEAKANALLTKSLTPELIQWKSMENSLKALEKWDGKLPQVNGGSVPFINLHASTDKN